MPTQPGSRNTEAFVAAASIFAFTVIAYYFRYRGVMAEWDLYSVLLGLLDGAASGTWLDSHLHYDRNFGFGYIAAIYAFVGSATLQDRDQLMALINSLGLLFIIPGLILFWLNVRIIHDAMVATTALLLFAFSPMTMEMATSGHPVQIAFAFLMAGTLCSLLPLQGRWAIASTAAGLVLLTAGLTVRAEIFLAFPWLVLVKTDMRSLPAFIRSGCTRAIAPAGAIVLVFVLKALFINDVATSVTPSVGKYFGQFYTWSNIFPGLLYAALGCGLATSAAAVLVAIRAASSVRKITWDELLAPVALIVVPTLFFLPNPIPPRHFLLPLAGLGILIGWGASRIIRSKHVIAATIMLIAANQVLAEAVRAPLLEISQAKSPYLPVIEPYATMTHANVGWNWQRHAALGRRRRVRDAFVAELLAQSDDDILIISDEPPQILSRIFMAHPNIRFNIRSLGKTSGTEVTVGQRQIMVVEETYLWPADPIAVVLNDPALDNYKIVLDPILRSIYSKTPIPADRIPQLR